MSFDSARFVIHLPIMVPDLARARIMARTATRSLAFLTAIDPGEVTVSEEDNQGVRYRVFCDRLLDDSRRCVLRAEHETPCAARVPR
ncbi:hypothetical protein GCM10027280_29590 [Micromonospora polyrhachis]|uniref:Uncharacterized protein n=1 Tax=Micromonospora polyrhachis TaxID=1282883 RepID=A0A7W7WPT6_9ACTN|nr:hypothetical protein [Micromonospora polyrhachis]MBB4959059.1 hypothetical protein [Micromonospora polyrhachis]